MDPLSDVLLLFKPRSHRAGGFDLGGEFAIEFPKHESIKCYAVVSGQCWLSVEVFPRRCGLGQEIVSSCHVGLLPIFRAI